MPLKQVTEVLEDHTMREHNLEDAMNAFLKALMAIWNHAPFYGN